MEIERDERQIDLEDLIRSYKTTPLSKPRVILIPATQAIVENWLVGKSPKTKANYEPILMRFAEFCFPETLSRVTPSDVERFLIQFDAQPQMKRLCIVALRSFFKFACYLQPHYRNPLVNLIPERPVLEVQKRYLTVDEVKTLFESVKNPLESAIFKVFYYGGLRLNELVRLRWAEVSEREDGRVQLSIVGKGKRRREVLLPKAASESLLALKEAADEDAFVFRTSKDPNTALNSVTIHRLIKTVVKRAGITKPVSAHWLRHAHASHAIDNGSPLQVISETLGHSSIAVTTLYLHGRPDESSGDYLK